jgi:hypothetical protein
LNLASNFFTVTQGANGNITPAGTGGVVSVATGANQTFTITPNTGYHIASLTVDSSAVAPLVSSYTFTNVTGNHTIAATFGAGTQDWPIQIIGASTVNLSKADFETLAAAHPSHTYNDTDGNLWQGVALYRLIGMVDDADPATFNSGLASVYSIKFTAADGYTKTMAPSDYAANFVFGNSEDVFLANQVKLAGASTWTELPLTKPTNASKLWYPVMSNGGGITVSNMRVGAITKIELLNLPVTTYAVTTSVTPAPALTAGCSVSGNGNYAAGSSISLNATAAAGWIFSGWSSNDITISNPAANPLIFTMPAKDVNVTGNFTLIPVVVVSVSPASQSVMAGMNFSVDLVIETNTPVRGWQANVAFDANKLACNGVTEGTFLSAYAASHSGGTVAGGTATIDNSGGHVTIPGYAITNAGTSGPTGTGTLCTIYFTAKNGVSGVAGIPLSGVVVVDANGTAISGVTAHSGAVTVTALSPFQFVLKAGWNTFSTPISLAASNNTLGTVLAGASYDMAYSYNAQTQAWVPLTNSFVIQPCDAIYIHMLADYTGTLTVNTALTPPPSKALQAGWNLISLAYTQPMKADEALLSIDVLAGGSPGYSQVLSQALSGQTGWIYVNGQVIADAGATGWMLPGKGYWVFMISAGILAGFTITPVP